jgi:hypothetical protein
MWIEANIDFVTKGFTQQRHLIVDPFEDLGPGHLAYLRWQGIGFDGRKAVGLDELLGVGGSLFRV